MSLPTGAALKSFTTIGPLPWAIDVANPNLDSVHLSDDHRDRSLVGVLPNFVQYWSGWRDGIPASYYPADLSTTLLDGALTQAPMLGTVDACEPFWRIKRLKATISLTLSGTGGGDNVCTGSIYIQPIMRAVGDASGDPATSETDLPLCNRFESVDFGQWTWGGNDTIGSGSDSAVDSWKMYLVLFRSFGMKDMLHVSVPPMVAFRMPPALYSEPGGQTTVLFQGVPTYGPDTSATLVINLGPHWPTHSYTLALDAVTVTPPSGVGEVESSGTAAFPVSGTITIAPAETDAYWSYGGKYNVDTGAPT